MKSPFGRDALTEFFKRGGQGRNIIIMAVSLVGFILTWWVIADLVKSPYLPDPRQVFDALIISFDVDPTTQRSMWDHIGASLGRFIQGFALAMVIAIPVGLLMGFSRIGENIGKPVVELIRPIPPIAWVPFFFVLLGPILGPILTIFIGVFFPVVSNVMFGVKSVDPTLVDAAATLGAGKVSIFTRVVFPFTIPYLMTGITIGLGIGWMCIVAAEMIFALGGGVGSMILASSQIARYDFMFAGMVTIAILGLLTTGLSRLVERRVSRWMGMI